MTTPVWTIHKNLTVQLDGQSFAHWLSGARQEFSVAGEGFTARPDVLTWRAVRIDAVPTERDRTFTQSPALVLTYSVDVTVQPHPQSAGLRRLAFSPSTGDLRVRTERWGGPHLKEFINRMTWRISLTPEVVL